MQVTKCNQDVIDSIVNTLRLGSYIETAVAIAGITKKTFYNWMTYSHEDHFHYKPIYATLRHAVEKAQEEAVVRDLHNIDKCAMGNEVEYMRDKTGGLVFNEKGNPIVLKPGSPRDWSASAWRLSRRHPKNWSATEKVEHSGESTSTQVVVIIPDNGKQIKNDS